VNGVRLDIIPNFSAGETIPWIRALEMIRAKWACGAIRVHDH